MVLKWSLQRYLNTQAWDYRGGSTNRNLRFELLFTAATWPNVCGETPTWQEPSGFLALNPTFSQYTFYACSGLQILVHGFSCPNNFPRYYEFTISRRSKCLGVARLPHTAWLGRCVHTTSFRIQARFEKVHQPFLIEYFLAIGLDTWIRIFETVCLPTRTARLSGTSNPQ